MKDAVECAPCTPTIKKVGILVYGAKQGQSEIGCLRNQGILWVRVVTRPKTLFTELADRVTYTPPQPSELTGMDRHFATNIAPYAPPPDQQPEHPPKPSNGHPRASWFQKPGGAPSQGYSSYQSGGIPTLGGEQTGITGFGGGGGLDEERGVSNLWETRFGWRVDVEAACAYLLGPISALVLLILETKNDYVRFHAYQSALLTTPLVILRLFALFVGFWSFLQIILTLLLVAACICMAFQAYRDANSGGLARFRLPYIGELADRYVGEE